MRPSFFHHLHPPTIPARQARFRYTLGAGGLAVFLTLVVGLTGILELFYYVPTPERAAQSVQSLSFLVPFGGLVRNIHYWAAQVLVLTAGLHFLRVVLTGAYAPPRRFNYLLGLSLFLLILALDFSGYVLRWDQGVRWALVAGTNLLKELPWIGPGLYGAVMGGSQPGEAALLRFYSWHIFGITLLLAILGVWHIFRVRRDGGIAVPPPEARQDAARITRFVLARREVIAALLASAGLLLLGSFFPAPLAAPIVEAGALSADARAPWFFLWVQALLKLGDPLIFGVAIPFGAILLLFLLPYLLPCARPSELGRWFPPGNRAAQIVTLAMVLGVLGLTAWALWPGGG